MIRLDWLSVAALVAALAAGCSQKDPGAGPDGDDAGAAGAGAVADDYYPMVDGSSMTFRHTGGSTWDDRTTVEDMQYMGEAAFLMEGAVDPKGESSKNVITRDGTRWYRAHKEEFRSGNLQGTVEYVPGFLRFDSAWLDVEEGFSENLTYTRIEKTAEGNVVAEDEREHTFTVEKLRDPITVAAGSFEDCMRVRRTRVRGNATAASDDDDKVFWFCAGIGKAKEVSEIGGGSEELLSCDIPGGSCP